MRACEWLEYSVTPCSVYVSFVLRCRKQSPVMSLRNKSSIQHYIHEREHVPAVLMFRPCTAATVSEMCQSQSALNRPISAIPSTSLSCASPRDFLAFRPCTYTSSLVFESCGIWRPAQRRARRTARTARRRDQSAAGAVVAVATGARRDRPGMRSSR